MTVGAGPVTEQRGTYPRHGILLDYWTVSRSVTGHASDGRPHLNPMELGTPYDCIGPLCESAALESVSIAEMEQGPTHAPASISSREIGRDDFVPIREPVDDCSSQHAGGAGDDYFAHEAFRRVRGRSVIALHSRGDFVGRSVAARHVVQDPHRS